MRKQQVIILIIVTFVLGFLALWLYQRRQQDWRSGELTASGLLFPQLPVNEVRRLRLTSAEGTVDLLKTDERWVVANYHQYPADFTKIAEFLKSLTDLKPVHNLSGLLDDDLKRLALHEPGKATEGTGTLVELLGTNDAALTSMLLGKEHMGKAPAGMPPGMMGGGGWPDGRYLMLPKSGEAVVVSETFSQIVTKTPHWLDKTFIKIDKLKRLSSRHGESEMWQITRPVDAGALTLEATLGADEEVNASKLSSMDSVLRFASFDDIGDPAKPDAEWGWEDGRVLVFETFDGFTYTVTVGRKLASGQAPVKVSVAWASPALAAAPEGETPEALKLREEAHQKSLDEARQKYQRELALLKNWVYLVPSYTATDLLTVKADLIKKKEQKVEQPATGEAEAPQAAPPTEEEAVPVEGAGPALAPAPPTPAPAPKQP